MITFFGVTRADDTLVPASGTAPGGIPIFERSFGSGFSLVIEGRPGGASTAVGMSTFRWDANNPTVLPDLQIEVSRPLGNGSTEVCDDSAPTFGGVPAIEPPDFSPTQAVADTINDLACRFKDGFGTPRGRPFGEACIMFADGQFRFQDPRTTVQYCAQINEPIAFPPDDTRVTARIRDEAGRLSAPAQIVIRITGR